MVRVRTLQRDRGEYTRHAKSEQAPAPRNLDPALHPFERAREYQRALTAVKLDRMMAKPFVGQLTGHMDAVHRLARHPKCLRILASGACDGELRVWDLSSRTTLWTVPNAHAGFVRGLALSTTSSTMLTCGDDRAIKLWRCDYDQPMGGGVARTSTPLATLIGEHAFSNLDVQRGSHLFATSGAVLQVWDAQRSEPLHTYQWGVDSVVSCRFNHVENQLLASCSSDRAITLYDLRASSPAKKLIMNMRANAIEWNPMEAFNFSIASEDHNVYTFDMRHLEKALVVHQGHVSAVLALDFSPTGEEFVTGSYDRTLRIFARDAGASRDIYHTKRMQRIFGVQFSGDADYVLSASDDTNIRLWRAHASHSVAPKSYKEKQSLNYKAKLIERHHDLPEIKKIVKQRNIPAPIKSAQRSKIDMKRAENKRELNRRRHSATQARKKFAVERKKHVVSLEQ